MLGCRSLMIPTMRVAVSLPFDYDRKGRCKGDLEADCGDCLNWMGAWRRADRRYQAFTVVTAAA
jgi:hypothetical protein